MLEGTGDYGAGALATFAQRHATLRALATLLPAARALPPAQVKGAATRQ